MIGHFACSWFIHEAQISGKLYFHCFYSSSLSPTTPVDLRILAMFKNIIRYIWNEIFGITYCCENNRQYFRFWKDDFWVVHTSCAIILLLLLLLLSQWFLEFYWSVLDKLMSHTVFGVLKDFGLKMPPETSHVDKCSDWRINEYDTWFRISRTIGWKNVVTPASEWLDWWTWHLV